MSFSFIYPYREAGRQLLSVTPRDPPPNCACSSHATRTPAITTLIGTSRTRDTSRIIYLHIHSVNAMPAYKVSEQVSSWCVSI